MPDEVVDAIRGDREIPDTRLDALRAFATRVVEQRGWVSESEIERFAAAGFTNAQVLEIVPALSLKTLSNYVNHMTGTPLDDAFADKAWPAKEDEAVAG